MSQFKSIKDNEFYKRQQSRKYEGPKPEFHFYPNVTDEVLKSDRYDIDWTLSYADVQKKMANFEDIYSPQMAFANAKTADTYECFVHYLDFKNETQRVAHVGFNMRGEIFVKEWV